MKLFIYAFIATLVALILFISFNLPDHQPLLGEVHHHADFKVYVNGNPINFSKIEYMSTNESKRSNFIHVHGMDGDVIHKHMSGITLSVFFESIGMNFNSSCFELGEKYCNNGNSTLKMFVNNKENYDFEYYEFNDLDQILISYGTNEGLSEQRDSVTDKACIQSGKCKERGMPMDESDCSSDDDCGV